MHGRNLAQPFTSFRIIHGATLVFISGRGVVVVVVFVVVVHGPFACFVIDTLFVTSRSLSLMLLMCCKKQLDIVDGVLGVGHCGRLMREALKDVDADVGSMWENPNNNDYEEDDEQIPKF
ncbi:hypothetical protein Tco_0848527 [Tanacetum coccineum]